MTRFVVFSAILVQLVACSASRDEDGTDAASKLLGAGAVDDRPWEITDDQGESVLPDIFYAEPSQNEQVMPTTVHGRYQIDRLIYPTLGNPNLYVKEDPKDSFMMVLRIEDALLSHLSPDSSEVGPKPSLRVLKLRQDERNALTFYLVARDARSQAERHDAVPADAAHTIAIHPSQLLIQTIPDDMPQAFKSRRTVRAVFDRAAMAGVPDGLYDIRFEVKKNGALVDGAYEFQYNAVRVFERAPVADEYTALNVTDTQINVGTLYGKKAGPHLQEFVREVNTSQDPAIAKASFITFNGDLHNGGSPGGFRQRFVATTYNDEATFILDTLKELRLPIFLVPGNHDGNVSTGVVAKWIETLDHVTFESLEEVVRDNEPRAWPNFNWDDFQRYRDAVANHPSGYARDIFVGAHVRRDGDTFEKAWQEVPRDQRNMVLYDGFHQWRRTYGPLYSSFSFGKNRYVNLNTFDLRQHRRTGWGMYVVNYGGGMSEAQLSWAARELDRGKEAGQDVVVLAHHDPRGGHKGTDLGYYFAMLDFSGIGQSASAFLTGDALAPLICKAPQWILSDKKEEDCLHDGLSEWMRPDEAFDGARFSGYELLDKIATNDKVRTFLLGHTHYNSLEVLGAGESLVPDRAGVLKMAEESGHDLAGHEVDNPVRGQAWSVQSQAGDPSGDYDPEALTETAIANDNEHFFATLADAADRYQTRVQGQGRELLVMRLTSNADMTKQNYQGKADFGFSVLYVNHKGGYDLPQVNAVSFRVNHDGRFDTAATVDLDRSRSLRIGGANPVSQLFQGGPAVP